MTNIITDERHLLYIAVFKYFVQLFFGTTCLYIVYTNIVFGNGLNGVKFDYFSSQLLVFVCLFNFFFDLEVLFFWDTN